MKPTARIFAFQGREMRTRADITAAEEALMFDVLSGNITPGESRKIQKELTARIKTLGSALKIAGQLMALKATAKE